MAPLTVLAGGAPSSTDSLASWQAEALRNTAAAARRAIAGNDLPPDDETAIFLAQLATRASMAAEMHSPSPPRAVS